MEKQMFIKMEEYDSARELLSMIKAKVAEAKEALGRITQLRHEEESEIDSWTREVEDIEKKLSVIDSTFSSARE